jgi:hypothetical protein
MAAGIGRGARSANPSACLSIEAGPAPLRLRVLQRRRAFGGREGPSDVRGDSGGCEAAVFRRCDARVLGRGGLVWGEIHGSAVQARVAGDRCSAARWRMEPR